MLLRPLDPADLDLILKETQPLWEEMRDQRLFITGGTGFFGCWLLSSFLHANHRLSLNAQATVLTRDPAAFARRAPHLANDAAITLLPGDIRNFDFPEGSFEYVLHAATDVIAASDALPLEQYSAIVDGTRRVLEFAASHGTRKFLLTSSGAVYGKQPAHVTHIPEEYAGAPDALATASVYGEGKRVSELMCALYAESTGIEFKIARCFAFAGPALALDANFAIGNFIRDAMRGGPINIGGDGTPMRSYLYAADLAIWLWTMLFRAPSLVAFNVGSEEAISIADLARVVVETLDPAVAIHIARQPVEGAAPAQYVPSTHRAAEQLGLKATVDLRESIRRTAAWYSLIPRLVLAGLLAIFVAAPTLLRAANAQAAPAAPETAAPPSPELAGIAHIALRVHDLAASTAFYEKLGFVRAFALSRDGAVYEAFIKINDRQFIELYPTTEKEAQPGFLHLCFEASHIEAVHDYYVSQGLTPIDVRKAGAGNLLFTMPGPLTPNGPQNIEYTQYMPGSLHTRDAGQHLGENRVADEIASVTIGVLDPIAATAFYRDKLSFSAARVLAKRLSIPGATGEFLQIESSEMLRAKARFMLRTSGNKTVTLLTQAGIPFTKEGGVLVVSDPDGNQILLGSPKER